MSDPNYILNDLPKDVFEKKKNSIGHVKILKIKNQYLRNKSFRRFYVKWNEYLEKKSWQR